MRTAYLLRKVTGSEEIDKALIMIERAISFFRMLQITITALEAASGPIGWAYAAISTVSLAVMVAEPMYDASRGT